MYLKSQSNVNSHYPLSLIHSQLSIVTCQLSIVNYLRPMIKKPRLRFAPSPTGGLHLGGVRTVLFNYLFAKKYGGEFILRIEDTDQSRFVEGAEEYIIDCLNWCCLPVDEGPHVGGPYAPYRQSERKSIYRQYAEQLVAQGKAYYAFDTPEELESMREKLKNSGSHSLQYDHRIRMEMKNSLKITEDLTRNLLDAGTPYVIRIKVDPGHQISFTDMIRGEMHFDSSNVDDKILLKADGMPTYHLAVVVDDYLMKITHAFRGEEWLPSAPVHLLLWEYLGWKDEMPHWVHLPLILKPDGNGKLSKRDGERLGFPVFAMKWQDPNTGDLIKGFKEIGFLPEAFINFLAMLGWNPGSEQEIFSLDQLVETFSIERVHKAGAKFDFEKAKWFNHEWIKRLPIEELSRRVEEIYTSSGIDTAGVNVQQVIALIRDRCTLLTDFISQSSYFFSAPVSFDLEAVLSKWNDERRLFFQELSDKISSLDEVSDASIEALFKQLSSAHGIKPGELQMVFRIILVGSKTGPAVYSIASLLGASETATRINNFLHYISAYQNQKS
jgi:glutamyl-tRNA synthetase